MDTKEQMRISMMAAMDQLECDLGEEKDVDRQYQIEIAMDDLAGEILDLNNPTGSTAAKRASDLAN